LISRPLSGYDASIFLKEAPMYRFLALVGISCLAFVAAGCRDTGGNQPPVDLSHNPNSDLSMNVNDDLTMQVMHNTTTAHDIDVGSSTGLVAVTSMYIMNSDAKRHYNSSNMTCELYFMVQDTNCNMPPCGLGLYAAQPAAGATSTTACPHLGDNDEMTALHGFKQGDTVDVSGTVKYFQDNMQMDASTAVRFHYILADSITKSATQASKPTAVGVTDPKLFTIHSGGGWGMYEGTYVKITPAAGKLTVTNILPASTQPFGYFVNGSTSSSQDGAHFGDDFFFVNADMNGGTFPALNSAWTSIAGIPYNDFGGAFEPLAMSDFTP
jgi:hypothetical protein